MADAKHHHGLVNWEEELSHVPTWAIGLVFGAVATYCFFATNAYVAAMRDERSFFVDQDKRDKEF
jgi:hypothetical protein